MPDYHAHSANGEGQRHGLVEHLRAVAELAREFSSPFGGGETAHYAGLWHDLGKFDPEFQRYLSGGRPRGPDHKGAGSRLACQHLGLGGLLVQGHHGGLGAMQYLKGWAAEKGSTGTGAATQALEAARRLIPELEPHHPVEFPDFMKRDPVKAELWLRMVFSALVDADFLDTERHFNLGRAALRSSDPDMDQLWDRFQTRHRESVRGASGPVNAVRSKVYDACLAAAERPPGVFRLTVPTGGGKTLSALGFALRHASAHGLRRIVTATPFMSITEQTAEVYREFLEQDANAEPSVVLEHHSMADMNEDEEYERGQVWSRLAAENWDALVVVTTTVQLFHSLFSNRTSSTRKLHRLAQSVIILDEAQTLPPKLLEPILDVLRELTENYGASVVLSTATQPAFETIKPFADVPAAEIIPDYSRHFQALKRVKYEWKTDPPLSWQEAADLMRESPQTLAVEYRPSPWNWPETKGESPMTTTAQAHTDVERRHDFVLLFDVQDGNPNGDPDAGNLPRVDPETTQGLVTDVSLKRKVRDWVDASGKDQARYKIYVQRESYLTETRARVFGERSGGRQGVPHTEARQWMCQEFFDIRMFGAVMSMRDFNAGQVRGPLQLTFARSIDPILPLDSSIARVALERGERPEGRGDDDLEAPTHGTLGRKATVPYALYLGYGFFNPHFARQTGATSEDLELFWDALINMWDLDRSASRGLMACRGLYVFSHESSLGNAPAHRLFDRVDVQRNDGVEAPRKFRDYTVMVDETGLPQSVALTRLEG